MKRHEGEGSPPRARLASPLHPPLTPPLSRLIPDGPPGRHARAGHPELGAHERGGGVDHGGEADADADGSVARLAAGYTVVRLREDDLRAENLAVTGPSGTG